MKDKFNKKYLAAQEKRLSLVLTDLYNEEINQKEDAVFRTEIADVLSKLGDAYDEKVYDLIGDILGNEAENVEHLVNPFTITRIYDMMCDLGTVMDIDTFKVFHGIKNTRIVNTVLTKGAVSAIVKGSQIHLMKMVNVYHILTKANPDKGISLDKDQVAWYCKSSDETVSKKIINAWEDLI